MFEILLIPNPCGRICAVKFLLVLIVEYCASPFHSFLHFPKYYVKILLAEVGRENILKLTIGNESVHQNNSDNDVRIVNFATSKNLVFKLKMFQHPNIHKYTWTSPDGKTHNQIDQILIHRR